MSQEDPEALLVTGATGMLGSLLVEALVARGVALTVMVRPRSDASRFDGQPGIRVVRGDFDDAESLDGALQGVRRAFLLTNSSERSEAQQLAFVAAAAAAGTGHVIKLSQLHPDVDSPVRFLRYHAVVEAAIEQAGLPFTFVRPNLILQAYLPFAPVIASGKLQAPIGDARVSVVDARDVVAVAAAALTDAGHEGKRYDVTGPAAVSHAEIAAAFGEAIGRDVRFESLPPDVFLAAVESFGMSRWQAEGLMEDFGHYERGEAAAVSDAVQRVTGRPARTLAEFARDHAAQLGAG
jgi:uncharacterized protein YbjT (DUF2867 family)